MLAPPAPVDMSMSALPDDDHTVLVPASRSPADPAGQVENALPPGTRLAEFEITSVLGAGGFGIVYLAYDQLLHRQVAIKEYLPAPFAERTARAQVHPRTERHAEAFGMGLRSFVNEARMLAQFDAPSLLKVYRFWEENGTAYMAMPYYRGPTLKQVLIGNAMPPSEEWLRRLLDALLVALALMHEQHCYHRDIAPDNILMIDGERPVLLDFGAARQAIGDMTQAFTTIFKQGYAPVEQYAEFPDMRQGPWTDLFALASVVHFAIDGRPPPPAITRLVNDGFVPLAQRYAHRYSRAFLEAIDRALAVRPEDRPQDVAQMRALLGAPGVGPFGAPASTARRGRPALVAAAAVAVGLAAGAGYFLLSRHDAPSPPATPAARVKLAPAGPTIRATQAPAGPATGAPLAPAAAPAPVTGFDPVAALAQVAAGADAGHAVDVQVARAQAVIGRDFLRFSVHAARAGYVYVHMVGSDRNNVWMLFPNAADSNNRIEAGQTLTLPRPGWRMEVGGPAGADHFVAIVSDVPREFGAAGLVGGPVFSEFPLTRLAALRQSYRGSAPLLAGNPVCAGRNPCPAAYGAAAFTIEEVAR
jgi:hypothetical protein